MTGGSVRAYVMGALCAAVCLLTPAASSADVPPARDEAQRLSVEEFVALAAANDTVFDEILIDALKLNYRRELLLPARDIILSVKAQYDLFLGQGRGEPEVKLSMSRLFPMKGTELSLTYERVPSAGSDSSSSSLQFLVSQPVARNAFGRSTQLLDRIIGLEVDVIRYQIIEAYEDYFASLLATYYNWYSAYENLQTGRASYTENLKLLDDINMRRAQNVALPIDVNKVRLLVIGKRERVIALEEAYGNITNLVKKAIRHLSDAPIVPSEPFAYRSVEVDFERDYAEFKATSRTYGILGLLEEKSTLEVARAADDLLPSTNVLLGYKVTGDDWEINNKDRTVFAGLSVEWPLPDTTGGAKHEISLVEERKRRLSSQNKYQQMLADLSNINLGLEREKTLLDIADEKIALSEAILREEAENYSFGKVTLNDYIDAVNRLDDNRFNRTSHVVEFNRLMVEWLRLTDTLVDRRVLDSAGR